MLSDKYVQPFLTLPRSTKRILALLVDACCCVLTVWIAYYLRLEDWLAISGVMWLPVLVSPLIALPIFVVLGLYRAIFRYAGLSAFLTVLKAITIYGLLFMVIFTVISFPGVPRTVGIMQPLLLLIAVSMSRLLTRYWLGGAYQHLLRKNARQRVLIYGAGVAGRQLSAALASGMELDVVGFLDDNKLLQGAIMSGAVIYNPADIADVMETLNVRDVLLAMPSVTRQRRNEILDDMRRVKVTVRSLPDLTALAQGRVTVSDLRELDIEDLLGRDTVAPIQPLLDKNINGKTVLVTGAGGSIGSELCRQILRNDPVSLILVEQSEPALYAIHAELLKLVSLLEKKHVRIRAFLGSVRDGDRMRAIMKLCAPQTVYHAAAYKHVPIVENNPAEGVSNNVRGTMVTALAARDHGVSDFVLISTDKAVRPTNIMGASKRLAEMVLQTLAHEQKGAARPTNFSMVRFGNVLGSSGSVVPLFRQQIRDGGPVTVTHPDITRYFMTIQEAAQLVIQAGAMSDGGDVFLLEMGAPVKIMDLALRMIELSGLSLRDDSNPDGDIEIEVTGLRSAEKLYEELLIGDDPQPTAHPRIMKAEEDFLPWDTLCNELEGLQKALDDNEIETARGMLKKLVSGYTCNEEQAGCAELTECTEQFSSII